VPEVTFCAGPIAAGVCGGQHLAMPSLFRHLLRPLSLAGLVTVLAVGLSFAVQHNGAGLSLLLLAVFLLLFVVHGWASMPSRVRAVAAVLQALLAVALVAL